MSANAVVVTGTRFLTSEERWKANFSKDTEPKSVTKLIQEITAKAPFESSHASNFSVQTFGQDKCYVVSFMVEADSAEKSERFARKVLIPAFESAGYELPSLRIVKWDINEVLHS